MKTALLALSFGFALCALGPLLDGHGEEQEQARALEDAVKQEEAQERFEHRARLVCGDNAGFRQTESAGEIVCLTKHGKPRGKVQL